jgi:arsenate reductase
MPLPTSDDRILLLHNPRCSKSRAALQLLEQQGVPVDVRRYLDEPLDRGELEDLARRLERSPLEWVRRGEAAWKEGGLAPDSAPTDVLAAMVEHPVLMERPIAIRGGRARVGRPPDAVLELVD